jgi:hypothetical protein
MLQTIEQSDKEKLKMYMGLKKKKLAKMLIQANKIIASQPIITYTNATETGNPIIDYNRTTCTN